MEKIEKLEGSYDVPQLKQKLNEIIDYLNTQPRAEEKDKFLVESRIYPERTLGKLIKETLEDTPEQKEEWEEDFRGFLDFVIEDDSNKKEVVEKVKQLLSEREREAREEGFREGADIVESDYIRKVKKLEKRLSKFTTK